MEALVKKALITTGWSPRKPWDKKSNWTLFQAISPFGGKLLLVTKLRTREIEKKFLVKLYGWVTILNWMWYKSNETSQEKRKKLVYVSILKLLIKPAGKILDSRIGSAHRCWLCMQYYSVITNRCNWTLRGQPAHISFL